MPRSNPIFVALDRPDLARATALARAVRSEVGGFKVGLELIMAEGPDAVRAIVAMGLPVFVDVKLHDIPNTVAGAVRSLAGLGIAFLTLHAAGGPAMLRAAAEAAAGAPMPPRLLAVTVLTSLDRADLEATGVGADPLGQTVRLARLAEACGIDGIVCSPHEILAVRAVTRQGLIVATPGIRPTTAAPDDQKRAMTAAAALAAGADLLVVGRPITGAENPAAAARALLADLPRAA